MSHRSMAACLPLVMALTACEPDQASDPAAAHRHPGPQAANPAVSARSVAADLTVLRQATAGFHDFAVARDAEWNTVIPIPDCFSSAEGAMGFHYGNLGLLDGTVNAAEPEALLYEPQKDGSLRLVGVEYIVPRALWTETEPPQLFGQTYAYVEEFDVYGLHVWVWRNNPNGMFAPWNPKVSCAYAE